VGLSEELHPCLDRIEKDAIKEEESNFRIDLDYVKTHCLQAKAEVENILQREAV
jgi:hypothetical protein